MTELATNEEKKCGICRWGTLGAYPELLFGPWMQKSDITVHYHCLLLSTNLPQDGEPDSPMNGFLLRDIRAEIEAAGKRTCAYCDKVGAAIQCDKCKCYFDMGCGIRNDCLFQFVGEFKSFCNYCYPLDECQKNTKNNWKPSLCFICNDAFVTSYNPTEHLYAPCCGNGFVHRICMQKYALSAGYYLRCIWCRSGSFRESIKFQGIFVPDREARWETKGEYEDLHRGHLRCDVNNCLCPRGRKYSSVGCWKLINCTLCGSFGVHYPFCVPKSKDGKIPEMKEFTCETCEITEKSLLEKTNALLLDNVAEHNELYLCKSFAQNDLQHPKDTTDEKVQQETLEESLIQCECVVPSTESPKSNNSNESDFDFKEIELMDFRENFELAGKCKLRINMKSPRFRNKTLKDIVNNPEILQEKDIHEITGDIMPLNKVKYILGGRKGKEFLSQHCANLSLQK